MSRPKSTIADQIGAAQLAIDNSLSDDEIKTLVAAYGYNAAKLLEGKQFLGAAQTAVALQERASGAQQNATLAFNAAKTQAVDAYQALAKVARAVIGFGDLAGLSLDGPMPRGATAFQTAARSLFTNAAALPLLAQYGYDDARFQAESAKLAAFDDANDRQEKAKGAAQQATLEQDAALEALNRWAAQYVKIARVALRAKPQLLEKLGVVARTSPTAAQRAARKKDTTTSPTS